MTHEDLIRPKGMPIWASGWWTGDPLTGRRLHKVAQHARTAYESLCFFCACSLGLRAFLNGLLLVAGAVNQEVFFPLPLAHACYGSLPALSDGLLLLPGASEQEELLLLPPVHAPQANLLPV